MRGKPVDSSILNRHRQVSRLLVAHGTDYCIQYCEDGCYHRHVLKSKMHTIHEKDLLKAFPFKLSLGIIVFGSENFLAVKKHSLHPI